MRSINLTAGLLLSSLCVQAFISVDQYRRAHLDLERAQAGLETVRATLRTQQLSEEAHRRFAEAVDGWLKGINEQRQPTLPVCRR